MMIYPTMELLGGRCVSLTRGRIEEASIWHVDPVETARFWAADGAEWMHLTDLDGVDGGNRNADLVVEIIRSVGIPVQLAGGFRTADSVSRWIDKGVGRIVISTLATQDPVTVKALAKTYPDQIVLSVDVWKGHVMIDGWRTQSAYAPEDFIKAYNDAPLAGIVVTDIESDIGDYDAQLGVVSGLAEIARSPVIANGVIRTVDDVARLNYVPNISGAMLGRALFQKTVSLKDALEISKPQTEPVAEFI